MKKNVFLICTGLGRINRGYESFTRECFDALQDTKEFELYLIKGGGKKNTHEIVLPNFYRKGKAAILTGKILNKEPYLVEQFTFCLSLLPYIVFRKPAVIFYSDFILGTYLWHLRKIFKFRYKLLFSNGAPNPPPHKTEDHVHQLLPFYLERALNAGEPLLSQTLIPYGFKIDMPEKIGNLSKKQTLRQKFKFQPNQKIILTVGAINKHHKRMNYVIEETALLPDNYILVILGQFEKETAELIDLANSKIPGRNIIANIPMEEVTEYYMAADYFILASLSEGFGRVIIEALSNGLTPIVHDYPVTRQILGDYGIFQDLTKKEALADALRKIEASSLEKEEIINYSWKNYSWYNLKGKYENMIKQLT